MVKKLDNFLNILMGACVGVFIGHGIYTFWDYTAHPDLYAMQSAPWYTSVFVYGIFTLAVVIVAITIKLMLRRKLKQQ